ncbi:hypothetical protein C8J55DRAFT_560838 [Lentinula edodes]|uniref:N-acetyltransferase domain-containing protein n=1 Tax=Lentinula lateritia TaxID=40482 RepID=A0A9W9AFC3_9AGAR|nr:hypothetical protein C8J55DRAFT_560838 [Lentinula edodes]
MDLRANLFDELQSQFCPPLDSSLVAAFLLDLEPNLEPTQEQINILRSTLSELASQADVLQSAEDFSDIGVTDDLSTPSFTHGDTSNSRSGSETSQQPFSTPLGFLQAAFPELQTQKLERALLDVKMDDDVNLNMWDIVSRLLSEELIQEMEERGLDGLDDVDGYPAEIESSWETVGKKRSVDNERRKKKQGNSRHKIALVDIRQKQHSKPTNYTSPNHSRSFPTPDPWTQIYSLSTHLATLLAPQEASFFTSYFHSPKYSTPYVALVEALQEISKKRSMDVDLAPLIISLLDILLPLYDDLDPEQRARLVSDIELSLSATQGHADETLDLVQLLRDLDKDSSSGYLEMGIYHQPIGSNPPSDDIRPVGTPLSRVSSRTSQLPPGPPEIPSPPSLKNNATPTRSGNQASPYQWQVVPKRKARKTPHPLAPFIPAYSRDVNGIKVRGSGNGLGKGGKGDVGELRKRIGDSVRKRDEMLREASRMWQKGNSKTRGGEVALYFADRARQFQELAKKDALEAARMMVESKRLSSQERDAIDLHGTTACEAIIIVSEHLASSECSSRRGTHSANQISVLKPALRKALVEDGWLVSTWDGGLITLILTFSTMYSDGSNDSDDYVGSIKATHKSRHRHRRRNKRRKTENGIESSVEAAEDAVPVVSFEALLDQVEILTDDELVQLETSFEDVIGDSLPEYSQIRKDQLVKDADRDDFGVLLRRLTRAEITSLIQNHSDQVSQLNVPEAIVLRKLKLERERRRASARGTNISITSDGVVEGLVELTATQLSTETVDALCSIRKTLYGHSFASRLHGNHARTPGLIHVDWDTKTPWMNLMEDIREHYQLLHPNREPAEEARSAIMYTSLQPSHLDQVHDILVRSFWQGVNVSDSLDYFPEKCTVVASYKKIVVGVAIMSSPRETYITYLAVKHGWDNSNIATTMLYQLIMLNPGKDITLHVSANNSAMLLYNRFGFKSEEFIAGFYDAYLDPESRASKNAVRLRLRHH